MVGSKIHANEEVPSYLQKRNLSDAEQIKKNLEFLYQIIVVVLLPATSTRASDWSVSTVVGIIWKQWH